MGLFVLLAVGALLGGGMLRFNGYLTTRTLVSRGGIPGGADPVGSGS